MRRRSEGWIVDLATHPRRYVSLRVAARYLEVDRRTLNKMLADGLLDSTSFGARQRIAIVELAAFEERQRGASVPRGTAIRGNVRAS